MEWSESVFDGRRREMVEGLRRSGIMNARVLEAFLEVRRHLFFPESEREHAYDDAAWPIGHGQTISQPYTVAYMTSLLADRVPSGKVLEVGTGSGYQSAILDAMGYRVFTIERVAALYSEALGRFRRFALPVAAKLGDGSEGWPEEAPFNAVLVTAAAPKEPEALLRQLSDNGCLVIPLGGMDVQQMTVITRRGEVFLKERYHEFAFVPLIGREGWEEEQEQS
ncbi:protein-L-isoaspartate(D-aspartate) O-methyltransferase [Pelodictyon luteolum]|uniref:Protein-L-isoaspartate O-methyltransferase n=1 Tax=Chlorobium luteolum (strain DSM 273 / BCRC 81028 / 2530) TaxID=319225 RepID=PIMT_CHLL3|nr:protein-L-isoaspartate(D-aspartate) O-methyltransferase [Pelodictyon luteolum]Q3B1L6.1 RecName: Full=Protein-L-isoaspartate O-methyltransferase; AltName: Full=L-isoaspartyl protein carboxyl methyltransferase; AltName: Full=Protein L-isoaspartyl methyltransferase; AltName: Full=Protein-beta-aspartate methyltransferase; Short=PIMT [Pelodictyon luteolum DSM 273]ABB24765.1 Protein-L-isoaspartate(D-aspartate) O-methyltransferase [Pelodictyon luteolum DSM 273]